MKAWARPLGYVAVLAVISGAYYIGRARRGDNAADQVGACDGLQ